MVLDPHTHAWAPPSPEHPWVTGSIMEDVESFSVSPIYTEDKLLDEMDRVGIDETVVVGYPLPEWTDNADTVEMVREHDRLYGVAMIDPLADDAAEKVREYATVDDMLGVRVSPIFPHDEMYERVDPGASWLLDAIDESEVWDAIRETGMFVQLLVHYEQLDQVQELVDAHPDLTYGIDHFAQAGAETDPETALADLEPLAENETVFVKASEATHRSNDGFPYADVHEHLHWLLDTFGRERVVWGSDYPNVSDEADYTDTLHWLDHVDGLSDSDREWLTGRAFRQIVPRY